MKKKGKISVSVIIPCLNEERYIRGCLDSVLNGDYPVDQLEILVVDGGSNDATRSIVDEYSVKHKQVVLLHNPLKTAPTAMNIGIKQSRGEYIIRLDAHSSYPADYISKLLYWHKKLGADNVGGLFSVEVLNKNPKSLSIRAVLMDKFGVGNSLFRIGVDDVQEVDTVPFGCYHRSIFEKIGLYNEKLTRNQDIELNKRIRKGGGHIYLIPEVAVTYYARENFTALAKNNYGNGYWNILTVLYTKDFSSLGVRHFIPLFFLLSLLLPSILVPFWPVMAILPALSLASYSLLVVVRSIKLRFANKGSSFVMLVASFFVLHLSYGYGSLRALIRLPLFLFGR